MNAPAISGRCPVRESYSGGIGSVGKGMFERESGTAFQAVIFYTQAGCLCHEHAREIVSFSATVATVTVNSSAPFPSVILNPPQADEGPHIGCLITPFDLACPQASAVRSLAPLGMTAGVRQLCAGARTLNLPDVDLTSPGRAETLHKANACRERRIDRRESPQTRENRAYRMLRRCRPGRHRRRSHRLRRSSGHFEKA